MRMQLETILTVDDEREKIVQSSAILILIHPLV